MTQSQRDSSPIVLITGGSRGLGRSMALHLAERGRDIILTYREDAKSAADVVARIERLGRRGLALPLDVRNASSFGAFAERVRRELASSFGRERLYAVVNNAGTGAHAPFSETSEAQFDDLVATHLKATFFLTQKLLPVLEDGGRVLNVSSGLARFTFPGYSAYASVKGGVEVLTRYLARELGERRISVNVIAPGAIETDFGGGLVRDNPQLNQAIAAQTALGRVGLPDDIGAAVALLLAPEGAWITGQRIEVSGGQSL
ncbi:MAG TPA: SDR family oxidoreductase [Polyangiaceae bacterium]|nr:SDR family oxidoreductase [Polyangiaceae bacterium]